VISTIYDNGLFAAPVGFGDGSWFRNIEMFRQRFGTEQSIDGPQRLKNIYFVYMLELRALVKAAPYLQKELFFTGNDEDDRETRMAIEQLLNVFRTFPDQFDETTMFTVSAG
jgi:hypothetical protein